MAKVATDDGKALVYGTKVQFDCDCCCYAPEVNLIAPSNGQVQWVVGAFGTLRTSGLVRYCDTIKLYISTDGGATFDLKGTSGVGRNAIYAGATGQSPSYTDEWLRYDMYSVYDDAQDTPQLYNVPQTVYWKWLLENDCGSEQTWSETRKFEWRSKTNPPPSVDCNSCSQALKEDYTMVLSGFSGEIADVFANGAHTVENTLSTPGVGNDCIWQKTAAGGETLQLIYFGGGPVAPIWEVRINLRSTPPYCVVQWRKDTSTDYETSACVVPGYWTFEDDDSYSNVSGCSPASPLTGTVVTVS